MNHRAWAIYFMCMMLSFIAATIGYYQLYNKTIKELDQCTNQLQAAEGIIEAFKRDGR